MATIVICALHLIFSFVCVCRMIHLSVCVWLAAVVDALVNIMLKMHSYVTLWYVI